MATLLKANGEEVEVQPANGTDFKMDELHALVDGYFEMRAVPGTPRRWLVMDEDGKRKQKPLNLKATILAQLEGDFIVGDVLLCRYREVR